MPLPSSIADLSQTPGSNSPAGSESPITADDYLRYYASYIATLRDGKGFTDPVSLASATTTDIGAQNALFVEVTGTTTITGFGTTYNGPRFLRFTGILTLTHHATNLNLPGAANITTAAGDTCIVVPNSTPNGWNVVHYQVAANAPGAVNSTTNLAGGSAGTIPYQSGASTTAMLAAGTAGYALIANGAAAPVWTDKTASTTVAGFVELATDAETLTGTDTARAVTPSNLGATRGMVKLNSGTASAASSIDIVMTSYTAFRNKELILDYISPSVDGTNLYLRVSTNGGSTYDAGASDYTWAYNGMLTSGTATDQSSSGDTGVVLSLAVGNAAGESVNAKVTIFGTNDATKNPRCLYDCSTVSTLGTFISLRGAGARTATQDTDAIRVIFGSGTITGTWALYGWN